MKFRARKQFRFGPLVVNLTQRGLSSACNCNCTLCNAGEHCGGFKCDGY